MAFDSTPRTAPLQAQPQRRLLLAAVLISAATATAQSQFPAPVLRPPPAAQIAADAGEVVDERQIVVLARTAADADLLLARASLRGYRLQSRAQLAALSLHMLVLRLPPDIAGPAAIRELEALVPGVTAGVNHAYKPAPVSYTPAGRSYADAMMGWPAQGCAAVLDIGVIDAAIGDDRRVGSGPPLKAVVAKDFTGGQPAPTSHARMVVSLMAAPGRLVGARLFSAGVVGHHADQDAAAGADAMISALGWLAASGVRLVNISLAGPYNKLLDLAVQSATARGMVIVAAAGNNGPDSPPRYPAAFEDVLAVTAVDAAGRVYPQAVRGWHVDYAAPGVDVLVDDRGAPRYVSGTSVATPLVTARLAADAGMRRAHSLEEVRALLGHSLRDLGAAGRDPVYGSGLVLLDGVCGAGDGRPAVGP